MSDRADLLFARQLNDGLVNKCNSLHAEVAEANALLAAADKVCEVTATIHQIVSEYPNRSREHELSVATQLQKTTLLAYQALKEKPDAE